MTKPLNELLAEIWTESAKRWRKSAEDWETLSDGCRDLALQNFAISQAKQAAQWAAEDEARAKEVLCS